MNTQLKKIIHCNCKHCKHHKHYKKNHTKHINNKYTSTYNLSSFKIYITNTTFENLFYFPWNENKYSITIIITLFAIIPNPLSKLIIKIIDYSNNLLSGPIKISTNGIHKIKFKKQPSINTCIIIQGLTNIVDINDILQQPTIYGVNIEYSK